MPIGARPQLDCDCEGIVPDRHRLSRLAAAKNVAEPGARKDILPVSSTSSGRSGFEGINGTRSTKGLSDQEIQFLHEVFEPVEAGKHLYDVTPGNFKACKPVCALKVCRITQIVVQ